MYKYRNLGSFHMGRKQFNTKLDEDTIRRIKQHCANKGITIEKFKMEIFEEFFLREETVANIEHELHDAKTLAHEEDSEVVAPQTTEDVVKCPRRKDSPRLKESKRLMLGLDTFGRARASYVIR